MRAPRYSIPACAALGLAWAVAASGAGDTLADCRSIAGDAARLACYDTLAEREAGKPAAATAPAAAAAPMAAQPPPSPEELFGRASEDAVKRATGNERLEELTAKVAGTQVSQSGKLILSLDNGQVWSQTDSPTSRIKPGQKVRIRRGALGSYLLTSDAGKGAIRVHRNQ